MGQLKISIFTLGCRVNQYESLALADRFVERGLTLVEWGENADFGFVNSCALTQLAERKTRRAVNDFIRKNPNGKVCVSGCFAEADPENVAKIKGVKWVVGNAAKMACADLMTANLNSEQVKIFNSKNISSIPDFKGEACPDFTEYVAPSGFLDDRINLKIQDGCDNACSYCIIPRTRGTPRSRNFADIVCDAENFVSRGAREIILTGINISKFSSPDGTLIGLIDRLNSIPDLKRIRIGSIEPPNFPLEQLTERMADNSHKLCPHLHLSAQNLNDNVLSSMRRKYAAKDFLDLVSRARSLCPDISIGADIICGHPQESDADFSETLANAEISGMAYIHAFAFSPRPRTLACIMPNTPAKEVRAARAAQMRDVSAKLKAAFFASQKGKIRPLLIENMLGENFYLAHTDNYIQCAVQLDNPKMKNELVLAKIGSPLGKERVEAFSL